MLPPLTGLKELTLLENFWGDFGALMSSLPSSVQNLTLGTFDLDDDNDSMLESVISNLTAKSTLLDLQSLQIRSCSDLLHEKKTRQQKVAARCRIGLYDRLEQICLERGIEYGDDRLAKLKYRDESLVDLASL